MKKGGTKIEEKKVCEYIGKKVMLILQNGFKITCVIPKTISNSFDVVDKYGQNASIECSMISMIYEIKDEGDRR